MEAGVMNDFKLYGKRKHRVVNRNRLKHTHTNACATFTDHPLPFIPYTDSNSRSDYRRRYWSLTRDVVTSCTYQHDDRPDNSWERSQVKSRCSRIFSAIFNDTYFFFP